MTVFRMTRWFRGWVLALFVVTQVAGIVPLIYDHTLNVFEGTPVTGHQHAHVANSVAIPDADHHHGALDLHDQCCALHALAGPLPLMANVASIDSFGVRMATTETIALANRNLNLLDRPPKPLPLI